jgi:glycosyltransferase involved in cell wall biosynthesis
MGKNILFLATVDSHIYYFHIPFMKLLKEMGYCVEVAASNVGFTGRIEKEGFKVYNIPFSRNPISFSNIKTFFILLRLIREKKYIMLHAHTPVASFVGRIAAKLAGVPHIVYTAHGFHFHEHGSRLKNFVYYRLEKFAGKFTDVIIAINSDDYKVAVDKKMVFNGKVVYIKGVGVDLEKFSPASISLQKKCKYCNELHIEEKDFVIISIAELIKRKNVIDIIKALRVVNSWGKPVQLLVVGDGPLRAELRNFSACDDLIKDRAFFLGKRFDIPELLSISDLFVMTSYHEGLPRAIMEAMSMERPIVAYNIRGVRDLVEDGVNGFLVPFGDVKALSEKIKYLLEHPEIAKEMGKKGREKVEKDFSFDAILPQMEKLYKEILESGYN